MNAFKRFALPETSVAVDDKVIRFTFATSDVAMDGHRILPGAWESRGHDGLAKFRANPVFLWAHEQASPPIGKVISIAERDGTLIGAVRFAATPFANDIFELFRDGFLRGASVSWVPIESSPARAPGRAPGAIDFKKVRLLEVSAVPVPADSGALAEARHAGRNTAHIAAWAIGALESGRQTTMTNRELQTFARAAGGAKLYAMPKTPAFQSIGEWAQSLVRASDYAGREIDSRLHRAPTGAGEVDPSAGGYLVPAEFVDPLIDSLYAEAQLAPLVDRQPREDGRSAKVPTIDEISRVEGSRWGGVRTFWRDEASSVSQTLPKIKLHELQPHSLIGICAATSELVSDAQMLGAHLTRAFSSELSFKLDEAIFSGSGAGQPLGIVRSSATIAVAAEVGQKSATILKENIDNMWSRMALGCRRRSVWIANEDAEKQLAKINMAAGNLQFQYAEPGEAANGAAYSTLNGRPFIVIEQAPALGSLGDIVLADLSQYVTIENWTSAISADALFVQDQWAFRFKLRVDGAPWWSSPISAANGASTRSPFITLAARP